LQQLLLHRIYGSNPQVNFNIAVCILHEKHLADIIILIINQVDCSQKQKSKTQPSLIRFTDQLLTPKVHITTTHYSSGKLH